MVQARRLAFVDTMQLIQWALVGSRGLQFGGTHTVWGPLVISSLKTYHPIVHYGYDLPGTIVKL